jgi:hypothetical protein
MNVIACMLTTLLALEGAAPSAASPGKCPPADNRCKAELFVRQAATAKTAKERALYLHGAHRSYLALFDQTGEVKDLCAARRTYDQSLAIKGQPESQRASFAARQADLTSRERERGTRCGRAAKREPKPEPQVVATSPRPQDAPPATNDAPQQPALALEPIVPSEPQSELLPVVARPRPPVAVRPSSPPPWTHADVQAAQPGRRLVIAGGVSLGAGLALTGVAGYLGGRLLGTWRDSQALHDAAGSLGTEDQAARDAALASDYQRLRAPTMAMAIVGGSTLIVGAVLVGVGARRLARVASRAALLPMPGGLAFRARF